MGQRELTSGPGGQGVMEAGERVANSKMDKPATHHSRVIPVPLIFPGSVLASVATSFVEGLWKILVLRCLLGPQSSAGMRG